MKTRLTLLAALGIGLITAPALAEPYGYGYDPAPRRADPYHSGYAPQPVEGCSYVRQQVVDHHGRPLFDAYGRKQWRPVKVCQ